MISGGTQTQGADGHVVVAPANGVAMLEITTLGEVRRSLRARRAEIWAEEPGRVIVVLDHMVLEGPDGTNAGEVESCRYELPVASEPSDR